MKDRSERFDDTFKLLLTVETIMIAFSFTFFKNIVEPEFFGTTVFGYILVVILWCIPNMIGFFEYAIKVLSWFFLIFLLVITFLRLCLGVFRIGSSWELLCLWVSFSLSFPLTIYLKKYIQTLPRKLIQVVLIVVAIILSCILLLVPH